MKILLVVPGKLKTVPMSGFSAAALRALGHEVRVEDYYPTLAEKALAAGKRLAPLRRRPEFWAQVNRRLRRAIDEFRPDLLFTIYGLHISAQTLSFARKRGVVRACWWINDPFQSQPGFDRAAEYDVYFSNSSVCARQVEEAFGVKSHFLPTACEPTVHHASPPDPALACDVCFAGDWSPARQQLIEMLVKASFNLRLYGPWQKKIAPDSPLRVHLTPGFFTPAQMSAYFSNARIVLNFHTWFGRFSHGVNPRLFEAPACGALQIVDVKDEIPSLFEVGEEVVIYRDLESLPGLLREWLADRDGCEAVAKAGHQRVLQDHTYQQRMAQMLKLL